MSDQEYVCSVEKSLNIEVVTSDIFESGAEALVNPVNCVGVMGKGLAKEFKARYPFNLDAYMDAYFAGTLKPGKMLWHTDPATGTVIINFPTKRHWRDVSLLEDIDGGLRSLRTLIMELGIKSIAVPALGCGLGGLEWPVVRALIVHHLSGIPGTHVIVCAPGCWEAAWGVLTGDQLYAACVNTPERVLALEKYLYEEEFGEQQ